MGMMCDVDYLCGKAFDEATAFYREHPEMVGVVRVNGDLESNADDIQERENER